jgi:hypothetical protein
MLTVTVTDVDGLSAAANPVCVGGHRPKVTVSCPANLVLGQPTVFTAVGTDLDGEDLVYRWTIDGVEQAGQTGPNATLTVRNGQRVGVSVVDESGLVGTPDAPLSCLGNGGITTSGTTAGSTTGGSTTGGSTTGGSTTGGSTTGGSTTGGSTTGGSTTGGSSSGGTSGGSSVGGSTQRPATGSISMPKTGSEILPLTAGAASLVGMGGVVLMELRRRRRNEAAAEQ